MEQRQSNDRDTDMDGQSSAMEQIKKRKRIIIPIEDEAVVETIPKRVQFADEMMQVSHEMTTNNEDEDEEDPLAWVLAMEDSSDKNDSVAMSDNGSNHVTFDMTASEPQQEATHHSIEMVNTEDHDDNDDIAWESEDEDNQTLVAESQERPTVSGAMQIASIIKPAIQSNSGTSTVPLVAASLSSSLDHHGIDKGAYDRAVATASKLADWAGRAVQRELKKHIHQQERFQIALPSNDLSLKDSIDSDKAQHIFPKSEEYTESLKQKVIDSALKPSTDTDEARAGPKAHHVKTEIVDGTTKEISIISDYHTDTKEVTDLSDEAHINEKSQDAKTQDTKNRFDNSTAPTSQSGTTLDKVVMNTLSMATGNDRNNRDELTMDDMRNEVLSLLQAFDLPFIIAPFEAEAQCAVLEQVSLSIDKPFYCRSCYRPHKR